MNLRESADSDTERVAFHIHFSLRQNRLIDIDNINTPQLWSVVYHHRAAFLRWWL